MNPNASHPSSPIAMIRSICTHRNLIYQLAKREISARYRGSLFGLAWSFFNPLLMLLIYTFVFSVVFKARWGIERTTSKADFALILFVGLNIHTLFAEVLNRAPGLILGNTKYVKKVVFPLEILTVVSLITALFHTLVSFVVLLFLFIIFNGLPSWTVLYFPLTILPLLPLTLGIGWLLASLGVYVRDIGQIIGILMTMVLFLAPILYPVKALPETYQPFLFVNPLTFPIEQTRNVILFDKTPDWIGLILYTIISAVLCWTGFWWFQKTRKGFADVI